MKLLTAKKRKIAIVFSGGLGDTLLYVPFLKELKKNHFHISCIFYGKENNNCLLDLKLFDRRISVKTKAGLILFAIANLKRFTNFYINQLANGKLINFTGLLSSSRITRISNSPTQKNKLVRDIPVEPALTDAEQNLRMLYTAGNARIGNISSFYLQQPKIDRSIIDPLIKTDPGGYYVVQVACGNNSTPFKNWPVQNWLTLVERLCKAFNNISFIIVGDEFEKIHAASFEQLNLPNCNVLIGKTSIPEVFNLVAYSQGYIGLDSGIMHMAVALQKKTLTIFGASNEKLYGYSELDKANHIVITLPIYCRPCSAWKNSNTSRVTDPMQCPDFACLTGIKVDDVYNKIWTHFDLNGQR